MPRGAFWAEHRKGDTEGTQKCTHCKVSYPLTEFFVSSNWCKTCINALNRRNHAKRRLQVHAGYGGKCVCCGETESKFLTIDNIAGNGGEFHRKYGSGIWSWLRGQGFPAGWQLLCMNCNFAKGMYGTCPHWDTVETTRETGLRPEDIVQYR